MRFKLGYATGFATGYFLGAKAGRQRYDQINRALRKLRKSEVVEKAAVKAKDTVTHVLPHRSNTSEAGDADGSPHGTNTVPTAALTGSSPAPSPATTGRYSSSR